MDGEVRVTIAYYLKEIVHESPETIQGRVMTPASEHLFTSREDDDRKKLDEYQATAFHHSVEQLLFTTARIRKDIQTTVELLTTRVSIPEENDCQKLQQVIQ